MTDSFAQGLVGVTLDGRYRLDAVLGEGGMGSVFRATQLAMDRKVAVKLLKPHLTSDDAALQRFAREARATLKVDSPHAVKVLDFGVTPLHDYYMVLEYLDGRTVHRELEIDGPFAPVRVAHIARQALHALGAAHDHGLIHRDVKPDNLLLMRVGGDPDYTKILDFGVAKLMQGASDRSQLALTAAGMVFGTPEFMSPEQACGHELDGRSDLYSLAATMYVMLTGTALFEGKSPIELLTHHARTPPPGLAIARPELAAYPELDELLQRCLAKHREQRPRNAAEMAALIERIEPTLSRDPRSAPRPPGAEAPTPPPAFHASSYFQVLRDAELTGAAQLSARMPPAIELPRAVKRSRRGWTLWLVGVAIASLVGIALGVVIRRSTPRPPQGDIAIAPDLEPSANPSGSNPSGSNPSGSSPSGSSPSTSNPSGTNPSTANPTGTSPSTTNPSTANPSGTNPSGTNPGTSPSTAKPSTNNPSTSNPSAANPSTSNPSTSNPSAANPSTSNPSAANPSTSNPSTSNPSTAKPSGFNQSGANPLTSNPSTGKPAGTNPAGTNPAGGNPSTSNPSTAKLAGASPAAPVRGGTGARTAAQRKAEAKEHLRAAEDAFRARNSLKQLAEADLALKADPSSVRAKFLLGDALTKDGDLDRGCRYLRAVKRLAEARESARAAGCPGD